MKLQLSISQGLLLRCEFSSIKLLINKLRAKLRSGGFIRVENDEVAKIVGVSIGYYPEVSYDVVVNGRLDERRESVLLRLLNEKISEK